MPLPGMLAEITQDRVRGLLDQRNPAILEPSEVARFEPLVSSAAAQVVLLTSDNPSNSCVRALAVEAIAYQTASEVEYAQFPEQQGPGGVGRGWYLHQRFLELLKDLRAIVDGNDGEVPGDGEPLTPPVGRPRGRFPQPMEYPDPAAVYGRRF